MEILRRAGWRGCQLDGDSSQSIAVLTIQERCAEASAAQAHKKQGLPLAPWKEIAYVVKDAKKWEVDPARTASEFDVVYYRGLLEKACEEAAFVFHGDLHIDYRLEREALPVNSCGGSRPPHRIENLLVRRASYW